MDVSSIALQGVERAQVQVNNSASRLASIGADAPAGVGLDTVDLSQEAVGLVTAKNQFSANIHVLKVADDMQQRAINLPS